MRRRAPYVAALLLTLSGAAWGQAPAAAPVSLDPGAHPEWVAGLRVVLILTVLSLGPALLILTTSFTRIIIVFSFLRNGLGLQQTPSNQLMIAYSLFLTFMIMRPVWAEVQTHAITPYSEGRITWSQGLEAGAQPLRAFMLKHVHNSDLLLFYEITQRPRPAAAADVDLDVLLVAFVTSELRTAFTMGFALLVPFLVIDIVVASILTSMGMMMLPPTMVSLPFKVLIFVLIDGWALLARSLVGGFR